VKNYYNYAYYIALYGFFGFSLKNFRLLCSLGMCNVTLTILGIVDIRFCKFKCSLDNAKRSFFRSVNVLFSKIGRLASEEVFRHLLNSKCMPVLLYSLEVCPLNKADIRSLDFTVTRCLMKLFRTCNTDIIGDCCIYFKFKLPIER